jgi:PAS domain S-box-containing protein
MLVGRSLYALLLGTERGLTEDDPVGAAILRGAVSRGLLRTTEGARVYEIVASPHPGGGAVATVEDVTSFHDLSEREARARDEVAAANARYRNLVEVAADAIYTLDPEARFTSVNASCEGLFGEPREALVGRGLARFTDAAESARLAAHFRAALAGETRRFECHVVRLDGSRRLVSVSNTPLRKGAEVVGVLGVARDVTDERERAAALERAEARYARLVQSAEDAICTLDEEGNFTSVNRALVRALGRPREALLGSHFTDVLLPEERGAMWSMFAQSLDGSRRRGELRFRAPAGTLGVATVISAPLIEHGRVVGVLAIIRDVTEERTLLEQMARREKLAALGELVGGVAHEVNTPLTGILAFGQLLQARYKNDPDSRQAADTIVNEARRAARIVGKLLTFARQTPAERTRTDINQVLQDTIDLRRYPMRMQEIELDIRLAEGLPTTWADPFQLQQVFINLLSNAEQAVIQRAAPGRRIAVRSERRDAWLVVTVSDNGPGIARADLAHIFNPFYTTKPRGSGTGLGLSISFGIVREHGGSILAASEPGQGATFTVTLPIVARPSSGPSA